MRHTPPSSKRAGTDRRSRAIPLALVLFAVAGYAVAANITFTPDQIGRGKELYLQHCAVCHSASLGGASHGPPLVGKAFASDWNAKTSEDLVSFITAQMPPGQPNLLSSSEYRALGAYILSANGQREQGKIAIGAEAGTAGAGKPPPRPSGTGSKEQPKVFGIKSAALNQIASKLFTRLSVTNKTIDNYRPVTEDMLSAPPPEEWLNWRRTRSGYGNSPLKQIDASNVGTLRLAWSLALTDGPSETTPLIHDGVMFISAPGGRLKAIGAATGDLIWDYRYETPSGDTPVPLPNRNIALYGSSVFMTTPDAATVALDARTGRQLWKAQDGDPADGFQHTSGPVIAHGVVIAGLSGCEHFKTTTCALVGRDPATGRELWRTSSIAEPGRPGGNTWNGLKPEFRAGGDMWIPGTYDEQLDTFYIGTAQAKPWSAASRHMSGRDAALFTNSTLAIEPTTGRLKWYFQHSPGDSLDLDDAFERVLIDLGGQKLLFTAGKTGILWKLNRETGKYVSHVDTVYQDVVTHIDNEGKVTFRPDILDAKLGDTVEACPQPTGVGAHSWLSMSYDEENTALVIPLLQMCGALKSQPVEFKIRGEKDNGGLPVFNDPRYPIVSPGSNGNYARLASFDIVKMKERWSYQQRVPFTTATLTTSGGLTFVGDGDRYFRAFNSATGQMVWQTRLGAPPQGFPITYAVNGKQYVAVSAGQLGPFLSTIAQVGDIYLPPNGNTLYVFELP